MYKEKIDNYFNEHKNEMLNVIKKLISIRSVREEAVTGMPFGKGPAEALKFALEISRDLGFETKNHENYVGTVNMNRNNTCLGILTHLDVVPEGANWTYKPFDPILEDGKLYGRGASDDKGPAVAALYAMAAVKELGIKLKSNVRLIFGTDEECGSSDIEYYFSKEKPPLYTFSPDGEFPVINAEKGGLRTSFNADFPDNNKLPRIVSIKGGCKVNIVPPDAEAVIEGFEKSVVDNFCCKASQETGAKYIANEEPDGKMKIFVEGKGTHASTPDKGINAITALIKVLSDMPFVESEGFKRIKAMNKVFPHGDYYGEAAGIKMSNGVLGDLTLSLSIFEYSLTSLYGYFDSRTPLCATEENTIEVLYKRMLDYGITLKRSGFSKPHYTSGDSEFVKTLLSAYEMYTGKKGYCMHTGGGTYVHGIEGGVCFGCTMPGIDARIHGADEFLIVEDMITSAKMFTQVIIDLCG